MTHEANKTLVVREVHMQGDGEAHIAVVVLCDDGPATLVVAPARTATRREVLQATVDTILPELARLTMKETP